MFDIKGNKISLNAEDLSIPPFKEHYNRTKDKSLALKEIEYIVWLYKWNTPYEAYPIDIPVNKKSAIMEMKKLTLSFIILHSFYNYLFLMYISRHYYLLVI